MLAQDSTISKSETQDRFLGAYRERPQVARAARAAGVHRATAYRWMTDPTFVKAMHDAREDFFRRFCEQLDQREVERARWRQERERVRHPLRCQILAHARAAKNWKWLRGLGVKFPPVKFSGQTVPEATTAASAQNPSGDSRDAE